MVDPHASGVISEFDKLSMDEICRFCAKDIGGVVIIGSEIDSKYHASASETILRRDIVNGNAIHAVFSPLHGTGGVATIPLLKANNIACSVVVEQNDQDPNFSTVKSPNPENEEALNMAIATAKDNGADIVLATDPDGDRLAIAAKSQGGDFEIFTGNVMGAMLAEYRISQLKHSVEIPPNGTLAIIKTFVTTPLIDKIANFHGVKCVNTLTGFKWIGEKMLDYENEMLAKELESSGISVNYNDTTAVARRTLLLKHSTFFAFGCEESYGCLAADNVRDKDANSACLMACELASYAKSMGKTLVDLRDDMYLKYGYFGESILNIYYDGAYGAQRIANILESYQKSPPKSVNGYAVDEITDFSKQKITDVDGKTIPPQKFFFITLQNGVKFAVRGSGTEPKIKFYLFAEMPVGDRSQLASAVEKTSQVLDGIKKFLREDSEQRMDFSR
jgi:phosphoglucomutase